MRYDIDYFISKFESIPSEHWSTRSTVDGNKRDVLGHCGVTRLSWTDEADAFIDIVSQNMVDPVAATMIPLIINDGQAWASGLGGTPKARILTYLKALKRRNDVYKTKNVYSDAA